MVQYGDDGLVLTGDNGEPVWGDTETQDVYGTLTELKLQLNLPRTRTNNDTLLWRKMEYASRAIDRWTGRIYYPKTISSEKIDRRMAASASGIWVTSTGEALSLPGPVISGLTITEDSVALTENTDYWVYEDIISKDSAWTSERKGITFSAVLGYAEGSYPTHIKELTLAVAKIHTELAVRAVIAESDQAESALQLAIPQWIWDEIEREKRA